MGRIIISTTLILLSLWFVIVIESKQQVPCSFFFGDSQFDNGNNNLLQTTATANYPPYGIDYPHGATGRFSNGRNIADFLAQLLGFDEPIPPFATARGKHILKGVNYASGSAGILDESGTNLGERISMNKQLRHHRITVSRIKHLLKSSNAVNSYLNKCLYTINIGSNDYLNNYLMPTSYKTSALFTPDRFAAILIQQYSQQLTTLYNSGARKIAVFGIGLLGCVPAELARFPTNGSSCVDSINIATLLFNNRLIPLIDKLNKNLPNAHFIYINITSISLVGPPPTGVTVANAPCCKVESDGQCEPKQVPCSNRNQYVFFDNFHPTENFNLGTATRSYNVAVPTDAYPTDIRRLVQL